MGYVVRHSTSNVNKTRRRGKVAIGTDSGGYQKTSTSGLYNGVPPVEGKHNFVRVAQGGDPDFYSLTDQELINFVNGLGERNLTHKTPSQAGWAGSYSLTDNDTRTFRLTTQQNNAATTSAWRTWYWDVSDYVGSTVAISADVEFISETNCTFSSITIGQGNTGQYTTHIAGSNAADRVTINTKPTTSIRMEWSGSINATGIIGFTQWINNVTANGANAIIEVSNVQIEVNDHVTEFSNPDKTVPTLFEALQYISDREDIVLTDDIITENSVTDGLVLNLDAKVKSSFRDNKPTDNLAVVTSYASIWNNSGTATWNSDDNAVPRLFPDLPVFSMRKDTNGNSHLGVGYVSSGISAGTECTYSVYVWIPSSNSEGMSGAPPYMRPFPANYNATYLKYNGSTSWGSWPRDQWIRVEGTATPAAYNGNGVSTAYISSYLNTAGDIIYYTAPQFENKSSATPFVSGSRTQTSTWKDLSGNGYDGTLTNGPTFNSEYIDIDGSNDYIDFGEDIVISPDNQGWTAEYWFNTDSASTLQHFNSAENDEFNANWLAILSSKLAVWNRSPGYWKYGSTTIQSNTWYQAVFVCDSGGTNYRYYINGVREGGDHVNNSWNSTYSSLETRYIGRYEYNNSYSRYFNGKMAKVKMYNKALSDSEISQNYYGGDIVTNGLVYAIDAGNLVSYEEGSTTTYSMTGSLDGTLVNGVTFTSSSGGGFVFDGSNDYIQADGNILNVDEFTVEAIVNITSDGNYNKTILYVGNASTTGIWFFKHRSGLGNRLVMHGYDGVNPRIDVVSTDQVPDAENVYVAVTFDGTKYQLYIDGIANGSSVTDNKVASSTSNDIGRIGSTYMAGTVYTLKTYDRALTHSEVLQNYNAQKARFI